MRIPSREALLSELDKLNHGARIKRVALLGRDGRDRPELKSLMGRLLSGGAHEGLLALEMARAARDGDILLRGLTHPSCQVQGRRFPGALTSFRPRATVAGANPGRLGTR